MQKHRIVIVAIDSGDGGEHVPLGAGCIAAALSESGCVGAEDIAVLQVGASDSDSAALGRIKDFRPTIVGFSLYCWNSLRAVKLALTLAENSPTLLLIAGGPDAEGVSALPDSPFHAVFFGEAEEAIVSWVKASATDTSANALHKTQYIRGAPCNAASLPSPWLTASVMPLIGGTVAWELTRGCPYHCAYCYEGRGGMGVRHIPRERLERELDLFVEKKVSEVFVLDPTFNIGMDRTLDLLALFSRKAPCIHWNIEIRAELLDPKQAYAFSKLNCSLQIGLQSAHATVLARIGRDIDRKEFARKISLLNSNGVVFGLDLIYGLPGDTLKGFRESLDYALSLQPNHLDIFPLAVLPGTELFDRKDELGIAYQPEPPYLALGTPDFPAEDLARARLLADACTVFYSEGRGVTWFQSLLAPLNINASSFLDGFSLEKGLPHQTIEKAQCDWVLKKYKQRDKAAFLPLALDVLRFYGAYSRAFAEKTATRLNLSYPVELVESPEALRLHSALKHWKPQPCVIEIVPSTEGPRILKK